MFILSKSIKLIRLAATLALLPLLACSCQLVVDDNDCENNIYDAANQYINVAISVSASDSPVTRANPTGGEYGDGPEKGGDRENVVNDITLIFFQDNAGVNTTNANTEVLFVKKYNVHVATSTDYPYTHTHKDTEPTTGYYDNEVVYTTGNQPLKELALEIGQTYQVLVVANADPLVAAGDKIVDVRDKVFDLAYSGTGVGIDATDFVMSSETAATITLSNPEVISDKNEIIYYFDCIHIERLAARIDFWTDKSNGYKTSTDNAAYTTPGYEYTVKKPDGTATSNTFVLTSITPFNLNNGNEYMLKRTNDATDYYLHDEVASGENANWVIDPYTTGKNGSTHPAYLVSTLTSVTTTFANAYNVTMAGQQTYKLEIGTGAQKDDIIIGYAKENTLRPDGDTPLYYYATGLAFEGYYYKNGTGERRVYYYFIRHQGEEDNAYDAYTADNIDNAKTSLCPSSPAMNFGIVRNNIYRISIDKITEDDTTPKITIKIEEEKWRHVDNPTIYL